MRRSNAYLFIILQSNIIDLRNKFKKEEWLSGLKRRFAKSLYKMFYIMGSIPISSVFV